MFSKPRGDNSVLARELAHRLALRFSERNFHRDDPMWSVPLYFAPRCREVLDMALSEERKRGNHVANVEMLQDSLPPASAVFLPRRN